MRTQLDEVLMPGDHVLRDANTGLAAVWDGGSVITLLAVAEDGTVEATDFMNVPEGLAASGAAARWLREAVEAISKEAQPI